MSLAHYEPFIHAQIFTNRGNLTELFPFFNPLLPFCDVTFPLLTKQHLCRKDHLALTYLELIRKLCGRGGVNVEKARTVRWESFPLPSLRGLRTSFLPPAQNQE